MRVVGQLSWRYGNTPRFLAERLGLAPRADLDYTTMGGNSPQSLVNATAVEIQAGEIDVAILAGGEASRTRMRARKAGVELDWPKAEPGDEPTIIGEDLAMNLEVETSRGIFMPVQIYPMFETAIRAASGRTVDEHQRSPRAPVVRVQPGRGAEPLRLEPGGARPPRRSRPSPTTTG